MVERIVRSANTHGLDLATAMKAIVAVDLLQANVDRSRAATADALVVGGVDAGTAEHLAATWIRQQDFLLQPVPEGSVDFVVGNPPYIRLEAVPRARSDAYRRACTTMGGRADVYVGFYEHGLLALRAARRSASSAPIGGCVTRTAHTCVSWYPADGRSRRCCR
jgi:hypothetical protein